MAQQNTKFIDVTRSFLPIDPMAFPESLHGTTKEDSPESRIPASAYQGYNFLPTSYGYKSYFGTNQKVGIDALSERVDAIFTFQTETFENLLIALTESGIWIKNAGVAGAWVNATSIAPPLDQTVHFAWTYVIISDELYCYQQGQPHYTKISSLATAPYYTAVNEVPDFLNMEAQVGIFRAGGRLGFWDSSDSVAWSSQDDFTDFTPSLETLAGNILFSDVNGRIVTIKPHGEGFIIYASKSVVYIAQDTAATFQWNPKVIISNAGIAYPEEATVAQPDTLHFAYTNIGLFKIDKATGEIIVPEVTDYLKEAQGPIYPRVLEGRYLFLQLLDPEYLNGLAQFSDEVVPEDTYYFPAAGSSSTIDQSIEGVTIRGDSICNVIAGIDEASYPEQQPGGAGGPPAIGDKKPGTTATPIWKCWISNNGVMDPADLTFGQVPCPMIDPNGVAINLNPIGKSGRLDAMTQDSTNKTPLLGSDVYVDGIWTIERFIAVQTAIWDKQSEIQNALVKKILNRAGTGTKTTEDAVDLEAPLARTYCTIGDYVTEYSAPQFGFSACSFWLTRFAIGAITIQAVKARQVISTFHPAHNIEAYNTPLPWTHNGVNFWPDPADACKFGAHSGVGTWYPFTEGEAPNSANEGCCTTAIGVCSGSGNIYRTATCPVNYSDAGYSSRMATRGAYDVRLCHRNDYYENVEMVYAYNHGKNKDIAPTPETAYCEIVAWRYTKTDNTVAEIAASACIATKKYPNDGTSSGTSKYPANPNSSNSPLNPLTGSVCSNPFEPVTIPGVPDTPLDWPSTEITIPEGSFLLQKGAIAPVYPDFFGALVYDLYLKKWGKKKGNYKQLLDYQPLNDQSGGGIPYNRFGIQGGVIKNDGFVYLFDAFPADSNITYGKIGYYRHGKTSVEEVRVHFRTASSGALTVDTSLDGRLISNGLTRVQEFDSVLETELYGGFPGAWQNITISGIYDISYLEYRGFIQGKR